MYAAQILYPKVFVECDHLTPLQLWAPLASFLPQFQGMSSISFQNLKSKELRVLEEIEGWFYFTDSKLSSLECICPCFKNKLAQPIIQLLRLCQVQVNWPLIHLSRAKSTVQSLHTFTAQDVQYSLE